MQLQKNLIILRIILPFKRYVHPFAIRLLSLCDSALQLSFCYPFAIRSDHMVEEAARAEAIKGDYMDNL